MTGERDQRGDKLAVVTGGAKGIGRGIVEEFVRGGYRVFVLDLELPVPLDGGGDPKAMICNVADTLSVEAALAEVGRRCSAIDALVCCAGVQFVGGLAETDDTIWTSTMEVNLGGSFRVCRAALPLLRQSSNASILLVSSVLALGNNRRGARIAYSTSKSGVLGLSRAMAFDLAPLKIRVNCLLPGTVETEMLFDVWQRNQPDLSREAIRQLIGSHQPIGRLGTPQDIAALALFLAEPTGSWITGAELVIDGGATTKLDLTPL